MKTKITVTGIVLCVIAACGVTNFPKIDPHSLDGLWKVQHVANFQCSDGGTDNCGTIKTSLFALINYPNIHFCVKKVGGYFEIIKKDTISTTDKQATKEDLKVTHINGNIYRIKLDNGDSPKDNISIIALGIDEDGYLKIDRNMINRKWEMVLPPYNRIEDIKNVQNLINYQKCRKNAIYSIGTFPSVHIFKQ